MRILIVDDLADAADSLASLLQLWGHDPRIALRGVEALAEAKAFRPHVLLVDLAMPGMGGLEVARRVRGVPGLGKILVVATTGFDGEGIRDHASTAGIEHFLVKPYDTGILRALLDAYRREGNGGSADNRPPSWFDTTI